MIDREKEILRQGEKVAEHIEISSQCLSCGVSYTEKFPWYRKVEFICPECGGPIDEAPFVEYAREVMERVKQMKNRSS